VRNYLCIVVLIDWIVNYMAGFYGKIQFPHENYNLKFYELKDILQLAFEGNLEETTEKFDGINIVLTFRNGELKFARNKTQFLAGGINRAGIQEYYKDRNKNILEAFDKSYDFLNKAVCSIPDSQRNYIFCSGKIWYSAEIIYPQAKNVINYDTNSIILHKIPSYQVENNKIVKHHKMIPGFTMLESYANKYQNLVQENSWRLNGPQLLSLKRLANGKTLQDAFARIDDAMVRAHMLEYNTIYDYLSYHLLKNEVKDFILNDGEIRNEIIKKVLGVPGAMHLKKLKEHIPSAQHYIVDYLMKNRSRIISDYMLPFDQAIYEFSIEILKGVQSSLISDSKSETERIKKELAEVAEHIKQVNNSDELSVLETFGRKIGAISELELNCEGIVFLYKGEIYKFSGKFGPINSLLGLVKYGKRNNISEDVE
jgi:hypothetical protein